MSYHLFPFMCTVFFVILIIFRLYKIIDNNLCSTLLGATLMLFIVYTFSQNSLLSVISSVLTFELMHFLNPKMKKLFKYKSESMAVAVTDFKDGKGMVLFKGKTQSAVCIDNQKKILAGQIVNVAFNNNYSVFVI